MIAVQICQFLLTVIEVGMCFVYCDLVFDGRDQSRKCQAAKALCVLILSGVLFSNRVTAILVNGMLYLLQSILMAAVGCGIYKNKYTSILSVTLPYFSILGLFHILYCFVALLILKDKKFIEIVYRGISIWRVLILVLSIISVMGIYCAIKKWIKTTFQFISSIKRQLLVFGFLCWLIIPWGQVQLLELGYTWVIWSLGTLAFTLIMIIAVSILLVKKLENDTELKLISQKEEMMNSFYNETRAMCETSIYTSHDMKNHFLVLRKYIQNREIEKALSYLQKISEPVDSINQYVWCKNEIANLIINTKIQEAKKKDIIVTTLVEDIRIEMLDNDLCSILSNLLDNAVEACEKIENGNRWIKIYVAERQGCSIIKIKNSIFEQPKKKNKVYLTSKMGSHGYGLKSVKSVVNKYHGTMECSHDNESFSVVITFI